MPHAWLARILAIGGILEGLVGVALLVDPSAFSSLLLRSALMGSGVVIGRIAGGGILSLGMACWGARVAPLTPASIGVARAFLVYNVVACVTLAWARPAIAEGGLLALGAAVLHGVLGAALLGALIGRGQSSA